MKKSMFEIIDKPDKISYIMHSIQKSLHTLTFNLKIKLLIFSLF